MDRLQNSISLIYSKDKNFNEKLEDLKKLN